MGAAPQLLPQEQCNFIKLYAFEPTVIPASNRIAILTVTQNNEALNNY